MHAFLSGKELILASIWVPILLFCWLTFGTLADKSPTAERTAQNNATDSSPSRSPSKSSSRAPIMLEVEDFEWLIKSFDVRLETEPLSSFSVHNEVVVKIPALDVHPKHLSRAEADANAMFKQDFIENYSIAQETNESEKHVDENEMTPEELVEYKKDLEETKYYQSDAFMTVRHTCPTWWFTETHPDAIPLESIKFGGENQSLKGETQSIKGETQSLKGIIQSLKDETQSLKGEIQSLKDENMPVARKSPMRVSFGKQETFHINADHNEHVRVTIQQVEDDDEEEDDDEGDEDDEAKDENIANGGYINGNQGYEDDDDDSYYEDMNADETDMSSFESGNQPPSLDKIREAFSKVDKRVKSDYPNAYLHVPYPIIGMPLFKGTLPKSVNRAQDPERVKFKEVTEVFDMRSFGHSMISHPEAFIRCYNCRNYFSTLLNYIQYLTSYGISCALYRMCSTSRHFLLHRMFSRYTPTKYDKSAKTFNHFKQKNNNEYVEGIEGADFIVYENKHEIMESIDKEFSDAKPEVTETGGSHVKRLLGRYWPAARGMKFLGEVIGAIKSLRNADTNTSAVYMPKAFSAIFNEIIERHIGPWMAVHTAFNCQAYIDYELLDELKLPSVRPEVMENYPMYDYFSAHKNVHFDIPTTFEPPQLIRLDDPVDVSNLEKKVTEALYFRSAMFSFTSYFSAYYYSNLVNHYGERSLKEGAIGEYVPTYVGNIIWTENQPFYKSDFSLSDDGKSVLEEANLVYRRSKMPRDFRWSRYVLRNKKDAVRKPASVFKYEKSTRQLFPAKISAVRRALRVKSLHEKSDMSFLIEQHLPMATPDRCELDATYKRIHSAPIFYRFDRIPEDPETAIYNPGTVSIHPNEFFNDESFASLPPFELPVHRVHTIWAFKGSTNPKNWTINTTGKFIVDPFFSRTAFVHSGFNYLFHSTVRRPLMRYIKRVRALMYQYKEMEASGKLPKKGPILKPLVVAVVGHSLGGVLASYSGWFLSKYLHEFILEGRLVVYTFTIGAPVIGNPEAYVEVKRWGNKLHNIRLDADMIPIMRVTHTSNVVHERDESSAITIVADSLNNAKVYSRVDGRLIFHGKVFFEPQHQKLTGRLHLIQRLAGLLGYANSALILLNVIRTHMTIYPCVFSILGQMVEDVSWGSYCSSFLISDFSTLPYLIAPGFNFNMKIAQEEMPEVMEKIAAEEKLSRTIN